MHMLIFFVDEGKLCRDLQLFSQLNMLEVKHHIGVQNQLRDMYMQLEPGQYQAVSGDFEPHCPLLHRPTTTSQHNHCLVCRPE